MEEPFVVACGLDRLSVPAVMMAGSTSPAGEMYGANTTQARYVARSSALVDVHCDEPSGLNNQGVSEGLRTKQNQLATPGEPSLPNNQPPKTIRPTSHLASVRNSCRNCGAGRWDEAAPFLQLSSQEKEWQMDQGRHLASSTSGQPALSTTHAGEREMV